MAPPGSKRPAEADLTGREKRMVKNRDARRIETVESGSKDRVARLGNPLTKMQHAKARLDQVNTLQTSIKNASYAVNVLAFQSVPRDLRRRTASHDARRLPQKLRQRAAKEIAKAPPVKRKPRRCMRNPRPKSIKEEYLRRQRNKKWLETHIWHTKRMKMIDIWGYRLAQHPNVKAERPCYRAFSHLSIMHDASYYGCLEWNGNQQSIVSILDQYMDPFMPSVGSARYTKGQRIGHGLLYQSYPTGFLNPVTFLWRHYDMQQDDSQLWMWIHPSVYQDALTLFQDTVKDMTDVQVADHRDELVRFDFTGPRSTALLQAILDPIDKNSTNGRIWRDLYSLRSSSSLPFGSVLGLTVKDPRLTFPQKVPPRTNKVDPVSETRIQELCTNWPSDAATSDIWDRQFCNNIHDNKPSDHSLSLRRLEQQKDQPATTLSFTASDSSIPILLLQRGASSSLSSSKYNNSKEFNEGWSLVLPRGWGVTFWKSFVFAGARTCGLRDIRAIHFESGLASFPYDYPGTQAWEGLRESYQQQATKVWAKKPPAKRVNFELLGRQHPFEAAFETLVVPSSLTAPKYWVIQERQLLSAALSSSSSVSQRQIILDQDIWQTALVKVRLVMTDGGKPVQNATIHVGNKESTHIGYLTTAGFSLTLGCGAGTGACTLTGLKPLLAADNQETQNNNTRHRQKDQDRFGRQLPVFVKNPSSVKYRPALLSLLI
ncbi:ribonucleases P/MRP protein subunit POP1-domain-containing protein [Chlamydoabsidia padenii]|nr:ribonucleases P/MRP protein subunit POP1-domain-containing protein [Chlamydoabsidia padenii]